MSSGGWVMCGVSTALTEQVRQGGWSKPGLVEGIILTVFGQECVIWTLLFKFTMHLHLLDGYRVLVICIGSNYAYFHWHWDFWCEVFTNMQYWLYLNRLQTQHLEFYHHIKLWWASRFLHIQQAQRNTISQLESCWCLHAECNLIRFCMLISAALISRQIHLSCVTLPW